MFVLCVAGSNLQPPSIPQYYVSRPELEKELASAVLNSQAGLAGVTVTITGDGGFGKSTLAKAFCHNENAKRHFTNGFILIELGSNVPNPLSKLKRLYRLLSHGVQISGDINSMVQQLHSVVAHNYPGILVIIDDIYNAHDAQPYVMAFRSSKIIATTRLDEVSKQLSSSKVVTVGPMQLLEATKLLSNIPPVQIAEDDEKIVQELVTDLYCWPLLICLARGQFQVSQSGIQTIGHLQSQLYSEGLEHIAYNVDNDIHGRKVAVAACVESSLRLLNVDEHDHLVDLVHHSHVGSTISINQVINLWNLPEEDSMQLLTKLDSMGLVMFTHPAAGNTRATIKIHSVISQYLIDSQIYNPPTGHVDDPQDRLMGSEDQGQQMFSILLVSHGDQPTTTDKVIGTPEFCLTATLQNMDKHTLPCYLKGVATSIVTWGTRILNLVEYLYGVVCSSPKRFPNWQNLVNTADKLSADCQTVMMEYGEECKQLNERVTSFVKDGNYDSAKEVLEQYFKNVSIKKVALETKDFTSQVLLHCDQKYKETIKMYAEFLYCFTPEYDYGQKLQLPQLLLCLNFHQRVSNALSDPSTMEEVADEVWSGKFTEQSGLLNANYMIKLQEVAPRHVTELAGLDAHDTHTCHKCTHASTEV